MNENERKESPLEDAVIQEEISSENTTDTSHVYKVDRPRVLRARRTLTPVTPANVKEADLSVEEKEEASEESAPGAETVPEGEEKALSDETRERTYPLSVTLFDWIKSILLSFAAVIFVFTVLFRGSTVVGNSMLNTLHSGERVIISDFLYTPAIGDIVVLHTPTYKNGEDFLIKRIIALGGQTVNINFNTWEIRVDGELLDEPYVVKESVPMLRESLEPDENGVVEFVVKANHVFVMGDNRNDSLDSRSDQIGQINRQYILGRVILRYLPFNAFGPVA